MQPHIPPPPQTPTMSAPSERRAEPVRAPAQPDVERIAVIEQIMTEAFGIQGRTLSVTQANDLIKGWVAAFGRIPTEHLEELRVEGLKRGCTKTNEFIMIYEAGWEAKAREVDYRAQQAKLRAAREGAVQAGANCEARDRMARKRGWIK